MMTSVVVLLEGAATGSEVLPNFVFLSHPCLASKSHVHTSGASVCMCARRKEMFGELKKKILFHYFCSFVL